MTSMRTTFENSQLHLDECDVCVVGSGASGGIAALKLAEAGLKVVLLEAGKQLDVTRQYKQHMWPYELDDRGLDIRGTGVNFMADGLWRIPGEPFTVATGSQFCWFRSRLVGGRTNHWGRGVARFLPEDFERDDKVASDDGWPFGYSDLIPYYERVESYMGITGPTCYHTACEYQGLTLEPKCYERVVAQGCEELGIPVIPTATAVLMRPHRGRPPCHFCAQCPRGCKTSAGFSIGQTAIPDGLATGNLRVLTNAMVDQLHADGNLVSAVSYIDKATRVRRQIKCHAVFLAASACESARILLNSATAEHARGLGNSSGLVGRNLRDNVGVRVHAHIPALEGMEPHNCDGIGRPHVMVPWWRPTDVDFTKGYEFLVAGGLQMPSMGIFDALSDEVQGFGLDLKRVCRRRYGSEVFFIFTGEMISNADSFCELDPQVRDEWGTPVLRFHFRWGENEITMSRHMLQTAHAIIGRIGGRVLSCYSGDQNSMTLPGQNFRESGVARMGTDPKRSVLNRFCQSHDIPNLYVVDAACFVTSPEKPPTLTIMAVSWMASEHYVMSQGLSVNDDLTDVDFSCGTTASPSEILVYDS